MNYRPYINLKKKENNMHTYRTHKCNELRKANVGEEVKLSGWIHRKRDHGGLLFIDLRDTYGVTQCVVNIEENKDILEKAEHTRNESVITITGKVVDRLEGTVNPKMETGDIEVTVDKFEILSESAVLPLQVNSEEDSGEETRLKYRFLDLRRPKMQRKIRLRSAMNAFIREQMVGQGFTEFNTPILTASSPEGARDYLVPSRVHPGQFYALPQAPQQFKQLLMVAGFDRYFQIAPCFRDEDGRADRTPGEFYQLDFEMSFVTQDDIFEAIEPVTYNIFEKFSDFTGEKKEVSTAPFRRIKYKESMEKYGSDKPDLRNPLIIDNVTEVFKTDITEFKAFKGIAQSGGVVRAIKVANVADKPRSFFDKLNAWAQGEGQPGLGYLIFDENNESKGALSKFLDSAKTELQEITGAGANDALFFIANKKAAEANKFAGLARTKIAEELDLIDTSKIEICWIVDFPMYEFDEEHQKIDFSHNPFSTPQGGMDDLMNKDPLDIVAYQYDLVINGYEVASGGIRNSKADVMEKAFAIAGYDRSVLEEKFSGMLNAFQYGAPPHGGAALGIDRMIMILTEDTNIREVIAFPMNQKAQDLLMQAPNNVNEEQLKELHLKLDLPLELSEEEE